MIKDHILTVSDFVTVLKSVVEDVPLFQNVAIVGELSNFTAHRSGHFYFSLKDEKSRIKAVMFRSSASKVLFKPIDGQKVVIVGHLSVYEASGEVQLYVTRMNLDGLGDLYIQYEKLKKELEQKGYFDVVHKKPIPKFPNTIGVITGDNSAALADMTRTLKERWPLSKQINYLSLVQGESASASLVESIHQANIDKVDVIVLARGGGSIEDLWAFNEKIVVEAVYNSEVPIVTGVGHESDTTLVDFVSDYRAATPTAAMAVVTPNKEDIIQNITDLKNKFYLSVIVKIRAQKERLNVIQNKKLYTQPLSLLDHYYYKLDMTQNRLMRQVRQFDNYNRLLHQIENNMKHALSIKIGLTQMKLKQVEPEMTRNIKQLLKVNQQDLSFENERMIRAQQDLIFLKKSAFNDILKAMKHLNPFEIMSRGYGALFHDQKPLTSIDQVNVNDTIDIRLKDGSLKAIIHERKPENE